MKNHFRTVNHKQKKKLEGVLFWLREIHMLKNAERNIENDYSLDQARKALNMKIEECDDIGISFSVQNLVLNYEDVHTDIIDVMKENNIHMVDSITCESCHEGYELENIVGIVVSGEQFCKDCNDEYERELKRDKEQFSFIA